MLFTYSSTPKGDLAIRKWLTVPEDGKHSLWNMCLQWNTTTLKGLAMSETQVWRMNSFQMQQHIKRLWYNYVENPPEGNIVAWHNSQMFSSERETGTWVQYDYSSKWLHLHCFCFMNANKLKFTYHQPWLLSSVSGASSGAERGSQPPGSSYILPSEES